MEIDQETFAKLGIEAEEALNKMLEERLKAGAEKYGEFAFMGNDVTRMFLEEIADGMNYLRMQFIKMYILQVWLEHSGTLKQMEDNDLGIGVEAFKGTTEGWGNQKS